MAAYIIGLFPIAAVIGRNLKKKSANNCLWFFNPDFFILTIEGIYPMWGASTTCDSFDILASAIGSVLAILTFEILFNWRKRKLESLK